MRISVALLLSVCAVTASAQQFHPVTRPDGHRLTVGEAVAQVIAAKAAIHVSSAQPRPDVIFVDRPQPALLIPVVGNLQGNFGTYFRSDVSIANLRTQPQYIAAVFLKSGQDNTNEPVAINQFAGSAFNTYRDFIGSSLQKSGLGALLVYASDTQGNVDPNGSIDAFARTWTPQPGSSGEVSQNFDAVDPDDLVGNGATYIIGLRQDTRFRSNVGVVNLSTATHTWTVTSLFNQSSTTTITVPPYSVTQTSAPAGGADSNGFLALGFSTDTTGSWSAYGTTNDNTTGDGWVSRAKRIQ